jgi:hypothetical protein
LIKSIIFNHRWSRSRQERRDQRGRSDLMHRSQSGGATAIRGSLRYSLQIELAQQLHQLCDVIDHAGQS